MTSSRKATHRATADDVEDSDDASGASSDQDTNCGRALVPLPVFQDVERARLSGATALFRHPTPTLIAPFPPPPPPSLSVRRPVMTAEFSAAGPRGWAGRITPRCLASWVEFSASGPRGWAGRIIPRCPFEIGAVLYRSTSSIGQKNDPFMPGQASGILCRWTSMVCRENHPSMPVQIGGIFYRGWAGRITP